MNDLAVYADVVNDVKDQLNLLSDSAIKIGIDPSRIIWDPGIGFAKTTRHNIEILRSLELLKSSKYPLLLGASRKRFIGEILNIDEPKDRIFGHAAVISRCISARVDIIRTHDVKETYDVIKMSECIF